MNEQNTSLAIAMPQLFGIVNFNELNSAIEKLATSSATLTADDKKLAVEVIDDWNKAVVEKLQLRETDLKMFTDYFTSNTDYYGYHQMSHDQLEQLADVSGTRGLYDQMVALEEEVNDLKSNEPDQEVQSMSTTYEQKLTSQHAYEMELARHTLATRTLDRLLKAKKKEWKLAVLSNPDIKAGLNKAKTSLRSVAGLKNECKNKANMAKLNISVSDVELKANLMELLNFVVKI